jgi:hypothetical protein
MDYSFLIGVHQVDASADSGGVKRKILLLFLSTFFLFIRIVQLQM